MRPGRVAGLLTYVFRRQPPLNPIEPIMQPKRLPAAEIEPVIGAQHAFTVAVHMKLFAQRHLCGIPAATHLRDRIGTVGTEPG